MGIVTLLTDFGLTDEFVGVMKGVIVSVAPETTIVDLCHLIPPQNIHAAARMLDASYRYFPSGTIHVAVVDPTVGSKRRIVALDIGDHIFLAPDNGLLSPIVNSAKHAAAYFVDNPKYFNSEISSTFHGRDIFAPVAGHLAKGVPLWKLGSKAQISDLISFNAHFSAPVKDGKILGEIVAVDNFGNLITNLHGETIEALCSNEEMPEFSIGTLRIFGMTDHYAQADSKQPQALLGSRGFVEIALYQGNAARTFGLGIGTRVTVSVRS